MNLTPEQLKLIQAQSGNNNAGSLVDGSRAYHPVYSAGSYSGADNYTPGELQGYQGYDFLGQGSDYDDYTGKTRDLYNAQGQHTGQDTFAPREAMSKTALTYAAILASMGVAGGALAAYGIPGITGGAAGVGGVAGDAFMPGMLGAGGSEVAFGSLIPGLEAYALPAAAGGAAGSVTGGAAGGSGNGAFLGEAAWTPTAGGGAMPGGFGAAGAAGGGGASSGGGLLESMGGMKGLLGAGATALGGLAGAQGQKNEQTTAKDIPEWLKPSVNGLLGHTDAMLQKQMAPGYMQGYDDMRSRGQGLLNQPIAGNPFTSGNPPQFGSNLLGQQYPQFRR